MKKIAKPQVLRRIKDDDRGTQRVVKFDSSVREMAETSLNGDEEENLYELINSLIYGRALAFLKMRLYPRNHKSRDAAPIYACTSLYRRAYKILRREGRSPSLLATTRARVPEALQSIPYLRRESFIADNNRRFVCGCPRRYR